MRVMYYLFALSTLSTLVTHHPIPPILSSIVITYYKFPQKTLLNQNKLGRVTSLRATHGRTHVHPFLTFNTLKRRPRLVFWNHDPTSHS
jgi:hypothetical protein